MNKTMFKRAALMIMAAFVMAGSAAVAQTTSTTTSPVTATCTGGGQLCNNVASVSITTAGLLQAQFTLSSNACSSVRIHWLVDGTEVAVSAFVGPTQATAVFNLGPVAPGTHTLGLRAEGTVGGCNTGTLAAWDGVVAVTTQSIVAATAIATPTLDAWSLGLLSILVALAAVAAVRMRRTKSD